MVNFKPDEAKAKTVDALDAVGEEWAALGEFLKVNHRTAAARLNYLELLNYEINMSPGETFEIANREVEALVPMISALVESTIKFKVNDEGELIIISKKEDDDE